MSGEGFPSEYLRELARVTNRTEEQVAADKRIISGQQADQSSETNPEDPALVYPITPLLSYDVEDDSDTK